MRPVECGALVPQGSPRRKAKKRITRAALPGLSHPICESQTESMSKADQTRQREQRLAAKLRENLRRRKAAAKAGSDFADINEDQPETPAAPDEDPADR